MAAATLERGMKGNHSMKQNSQVAVLERVRLDGGRGRREISAGSPGMAPDAYQHLALQGGLTPGELKAGLDMSTEQTRAVIAELVGLRLVRETEVGRLVAVPPSQAIDDLLNEQAQVLTRAVHRLTEGQRKLRALIDNRSLLDPAEAARITSTVVGDGASGMFEPPGDATESISAMHPGGTFDDDLLNRSLARAEQNLARNLRMRVIHQTSALRHPAMVSYLTELAARGGRVRLRDNLPFRMLVVDGTTAVCTVPSSGSYLLKGERVMILLNRIFETTWIDALPLDRALAHAGKPLPATAAAEAPATSGRRPAGLSAVHEGILRLLAEGQTDRSIARAVGITTRTVTRRISEIYEVLGVESRFQAGIAAKELGIV
jgi:DNA-binding CsgD family transcriptional regulator